MRRALITGASGFIGGRLSRALDEDGWDVHALVRGTGQHGPVTEHELDGSQTRLTEIMQIVQPDVVFHLASLFLAEHAAEQAGQLATSNIVFPTQLVEAMVRTDCRRLVNTGTAWQFDAEGMVAPVNLYAATKQAFDQILSYYCQAHALSCVSLRLFDTYGPDDPRRKVIGILLDAAVSGATLDMSPGAQVIDLTHVDDVVAAFVNAGSRLFESAQPLDESWFVSGERQDVRALVTKVSEAIGRPILVNFGGRPYRAREVMRPLDPGDRVLPGWQRKRSLADALPAMVRA